MRFFYFLAILTCSVFGAHAFEDIESYSDELNVENCQPTLIQRTKACNTVVHFLCDDKKSVGMHYNPEGELSNLRVMEDGLDQVLNKAIKQDLIFVREAGDLRVDREAFQNGFKVDFFHVMKSSDDNSQRITMSGTAEKIEETKLVSGYELSFINWDWVRKVEKNNNSLTRKIKTITEFHEGLNLRLGNYAEIEFPDGSIRVHDELSTLLVDANKANFDEIITGICQEI